MPSSPTRVEPWRLIHHTADRYVSRFTSPFLESVNGLRRRISDATLEESVTQGGLTADLVAAIDAVVVAKQEPAEAATRVYAQILSATATGLAPAGLTARFDVTNPMVLRAARELTGDLIRDVSQETKTAVKQVIFQSIRDGVAPRDAARQLRQIIGLTTRQAMSVNRLMKGLLDGGMEFMAAERQAGRYATRLLKDRALNIARTETMRAANRGQQLAWTAARNEGLLPADFGQRWLTTPDDRLCPRCAPLNGRVVQLGFLFRETERGVLPSQHRPVAGANVLSPPLHPRCRCVLIAQVEDV